MAGIDLNILLWAFKCTYVSSLASLGREDSQFELQTHERGQKGLLRCT